MAEATEKKYLIQPNIYATTTYPIALAWSLPAGRTSISFSCAGQAEFGRCLPGNGGSSVLPVYLTVDNTATDAILHSGSGHIITSAEHQNIKWFIGAATGNYMFPIGKGASFIPFTFDITVPGSSDGSVSVSSWYSPTNIPG
ncbi:MAG: hypothetical protein ABR95_01270 [Sphingobacteriales bacterium BACL12 MAG-120813-bin55]|jgi:hypothetical protein|nr:MAG: hypothetical protein ABR95_01270 [Sphingobacteriales bacterium BACL12 MAG-120813-bin55]